MRAAATVSRVLVVLAIVLGPPAALWTFRSSFLPDHLPTGSEVIGWFTERDTGHVFLGVLVAIGIVAWLQLITAFALEGVAALRGKPALHVPGFGWAHKIAAAVLLGLLAGTATAAASEHPDPIVASAPVSATSQPRSGAEPAPATQPAHTVVAGESLMGIARDQLGDERRYREIFHLNRGRRQPDGEALRDPGLVKPGWILLLPADAPDARCEIDVQVGDTLSKIAREQLGDARRYTEIFTLNQGRPQPSGHPLTDPDQIHPGDHLVLPQADLRGGGSAAGSAGPLEPGEPGPIASGLNCAPQVQQPSPPTSAPPPRDGSRTAPTVSRPPTTSAATPTGDSDVAAWTAVSVGGLLAAGILAALGTRRMLAHRRRRPGHRIVHPDAVGNVETALRVAEQPATVETLDQSLRALAHHVHEAGHKFPALRSVVVGRNGLALHPVEVGDAPAPFVASVGRAAWILDPAAEFPEPDVLRTVPAPCPALMSLGHDPHQDLVLVNLEQAGVMTLHGSTDEVENVLLAMAWDLAASAWADHLVVTLVGFGQTTAAHNPGRLRYAGTIDEVLDSFERRAGEVAEDIRTPEIILSAESLGPDQSERLHDLVTPSGPASSLSAVIAAADRPLPGAWKLDVSTNPTRIDPLGIDVELQRLTSAQVRELVAAFAAADSVVQVPAEDYRAIPPEPSEPPEPLDEHRTTLRDPEVPELRILGRVGLRNVDIDAVEAKKINRLTELVVFLALHPGVTAEEISLRLGTDAQPWSAATRQGYISRLRTWLGRDRDGELYLPNVDAKRGGYRLSDAVEVDWHRFRKLVHLGLNQDPTNRQRHLEAALDLVTGMPFSNIPHGRYTWSSWHQRDMIDAIVDVAHALADLHQKAGDIPAARRALARGLQAEPVSEILYRDLLRVEYRAGNLAGVKETADKLTELAAALDVELDEETSELVHKLLDPRYRAAAKTRMR